MDTIPADPHVRDELIGRLRSVGCVFAEDEADLLLAAAPDAATLHQWTERRLAGFPLEHIVGFVDFAGLRLAVAPGVFVPRRRTEFLVDAVSEFAGVSAGGATVVDLCCGNGAVGAVLAARHRSTRVFASDIDPVAVRCAQRNLPPDNVFAGDLFAALPIELRGRIDVITANAPYVPTDAISMMPPEARDHEPEVALNGGVDGLDLHRRIAAGAPEWLLDRGFLLIETSAEQSDGTADAMRAAGFIVSIATDDDRYATVAVGQLDR